MQSSALGWSCSSATSARTTRCLLGTLPALPTDTAMQLWLQLLQKKGRACHQCVTAGRSSAGISYGRAQQNPANGPSSSNSIRPPPPLIPPPSPLLRRFTPNRPRTALTTPTLPTLPTAHPQPASGSSYPQPLGSNTAQNRQTPTHSPHPRTRT